MAAAMVVSPMAANAQDSRSASVQPVSMTQAPTCAPLRTNSVGRTMNASSSAWDYSNQNPGKVGISIFPGQDLGSNSPEEVGNWLVDAFATAGVEAECFIHDEYGSKGTGIDFKVNSSSWKDVEGRDVPFNLNEVREVSRLRSVVAEAKTGTAVLTSAALTDREPALP